MYSGKDYQENLSRLAKLTKAQQDEMYRIERDAVARFKGQLDELEAALGMLRMGHHFGWRVLVLIHDKRTIRKYERILAIKVREAFAEEGPSAERCQGYRFAKKVRSFWKAVSGDIKVPNRRSIAK